MADRPSVMVFGSRDYPRLDLVRLRVGRLPRNAVVVDGDARGVDREAARWARRCGIHTATVPALWSKLGRGAGLIRNRVAFELATHGMGFWDGRSPGTRHTIELFRASDKPYVVYGPEGEVLERRGEPT